MKRHLEYPECSVYDLLEERSKEFPEFTALDYFGSKITYKKLIDKISKCEKGRQRFDLSAKYPGSCLSVLRRQ